MLAQTFPRTIFQEEFTVFLSARYPSSAAVAQQALNAIWSILKDLPVYQRINERRGGEPYDLLHYMREHPDEVDDMLTPGTGRNQMMHRWLERMRNLQSSLKEFTRETERMLILYFDNLASRKPEDYAATYGRYKQDMDDAHTLTMEEREEDDTVEEPELAQVSFPVQISFQTIWTGEKCALVERMEFGELSSFLHYDLLRGMAAGNLPRRCDCCRHWFLAMGAYDTRYCTRVAPGETEKTCRQVGPHRKEKQRNGTEFIRREYQKAYNRLKGRRQRKSITTDEWNRSVALAQDLKAQAEKGLIGDAELKQRLDRI